MSQNAIIGDQDNPFEAPETVVEQQDLTEERKMAKYSRTAEFKRLKEFMEARIKFYQHYLPDGSLVQGDPKQGGPLNVQTEPTSVANWVAACVIISEFQNILAEYDQAAKVVSESSK